MAPLNWATYLERAVGKGHPTLPQTIDRAMRQMLTESGYDADASPFPGLMGPVFNVLSYANGADIRGGSVDATPARDAATAAAIAAGGGVVYYPRGTYNHLTSPAQVTGGGVIYQGAGRNVTQLAIGADGVNLFDLGAGALRIQIRDMWLGSFAARASGYGFKAVSGGTAISELHLERITLQNLPNPLYLDNITQSKLWDVRYLQTIAGATVGVVCHLIRCDGFGEIRNFNVFATAGSIPSDVLRVDSNCDTVVLDHCEFVNLGDNASCIGIHFMNSVGGGATGPRLCRALNCYVEHAGNAGFVVDAARDVRLLGCHAAVNGASGFLVTGGDSVVIQHSLALQNQNHGIVVTGGTGVGVLDNTCSNNSQAANVTYSGIRIEDNVVGARVRGNRSGDFIFSLANRQKYGIALGSTGTDYLVVTDNDVRGNAVGAIDNSSTGSNNRIWGNVGAEHFIGGGSSNVLNLKNVAGTLNRMSLTDAGVLTVADGTYVGIGSPAVATKYRASGLMLQSAFWSTTSTSDASLAGGSPGSNPFTILGGVFGTAAGGVRIRASGRQQTQAGSFNIKFGATVLLTIAVAAGENWHCDIVVSRINSSSQRATGWSLHGTTIAAINTTAAETSASDIALDFRGSVTSGGTLSMDEALVDYVSSV